MNWRSPAACWDSAEAVAIIPVEAESASTGVFLATHSTIPITRRDQVLNDTGGTLVTEQDLLRAVEDQPADQPIIPILGKSGAGKSHLVRWLRIKLEERPSTRMIFVPKHRMSLRSILDEILKHAEGDRADELRAKVATAVDAASNETVAQLRLISELAILIETRGATRDGTPEQVELREYLAHADGLPALFGDAVFRSRLLAETGPIARLVSEKLQGKGAADKDEAFGFTAEDLNLSVDDVSKAGSAAKAVAGTLTSDLGLRELAAAMLNEQLGSAVSEVFGIGGDDLKQILVDVRVELAAQGLDLLLLVEDFSIFQGIQGGLIDAITLISTEELQLCPMRVVMAVTSGYFTDQMPDTVFTRTYKVFDLEAPAGSQTTFDPAAFAARYLNAVRVGTDDLDALHERGEEASNACDQCSVNEACHQAFGQEEGYGLFPFNRRALDLAIDSQSTDGGFVARDILTRVVRPVLHRDEAAINADRFPTPEFDSEFKAGALGLLDDIEALQRLRTPGDNEMSQRRETLVRFWGSGVGPENLNPTIHEAFGVPPIEGLETAPDQPTTFVVDPEPKPGPSTAPVTALDPPLVKVVDNWRATGTLSQSDRNTLRNLVRDAVVARLNLDDGYGGESDWTKPGKALAPALDATTLVEFVASGESSKALIAMDPAHDGDVRAIRALAWVSKTESWTDVPNGEELQRLVDQRLHAWAQTVAANRLPPRDHGDDPELIRLAQTLLAIGKALGIPEAFKDDAQSRVKAIFAPPPAGTEPDARPLLSKWKKAVSEHGLGREVLQQRLLRRASFTQGAGKALAIDAGALVRAVRDKNADVAWPDSTPDVVNATEEGVRAVLANLEAIREEASLLLPNVGDLGGEVSEVDKELGILIAERIAAGATVPGSISAERLRAAARAVKPGDQKTLEALRSNFDRWQELSADERVRLLTGDWDQAAERMRAWLVPTQAAVAALEASLHAGPASDAHREYDDVRKVLISELGVLADTVSGLTGAEVDA